MTIYQSGRKLWDWLFKQALYISSICLILLSIIDISNLNEYKLNGWGLINFPLGKVFYVFIVIVTIVFGYFSIEHTYSIRVFEEQLKEKNSNIIDLESSLADSVKEMNELFNSYLMLLVESLNFTHTERISVYKVYDDKFLLIGRSSVNPTLAKTSRGNYPINEGFIALAWQEGEFFIDDLPDPTKNNRTTYYNACKAVSEIPRETIDAIKMASRSFYIKRLSGFDNKPKAIIVIESKIASAFTKAAIDSKLEIVIQPLIMFIENNNGVNRSQTNNIEL